MKRTILGATVAAGLLAALPAGAQTLNVMRANDAPHYDGQRTTWSPSSDIVNMIQDTLVALDWDGKTPIPYLAKSWEISPDGRTYTFKLRDDVTFCSGKKFTADDVVYTFQRLKAPATRAPYAWRAGNIKEVRAIDP
ncbi:MAG: ABC transporter substrate-binding protein, partial [Acetobacteraceae bacterium]